MDNKPQDPHKVTALMVKSVEFQVLERGKESKKGHRFSQT
jgi:hypothetical protein